MLVDTS